MIDRDTIQKAIYALDLAQSLLEKSGHHQQIFDAYKNLRQAFAQPEPRKEWVGLTINEVWDVYEEDNYDAVRFARAIEAKLKEKNT
jgi:hypothetical protein